MTPLLAAIGFIILALGAYAFWALTTQRRRAQWLASLIFGAFIIGALAGGMELLGRPKPAAFEILADGEAVVLASRAQQGVAIYVWLLLPGHGEPRAYVLPWSDEAARALHEAEQALKDGEMLGMTLPFQPSWDDRKKMFHPLPQPKLPDKAGQPVVRPEEQGA